ncbi:hypothetical protein [Flavobacterium degerlachei]|jgi:hypothetical protein|uniref:Uncharacterized protein n=1 Tax=Flavobacterium degerlachei TaxID=229203 RepID=A0A1H3AUX2_9FLAO|nr:hypothetical protein [Flavobacterium degerlachei]SDX33467.1 hypothetical protein SAMN05444338_10972 [Flavobacterium degerlachei]
MEPNKLDTIIKDKLEARTIEPSNEAWGKLEAMMVVAEKPKRSYSWMYIAASFVGLAIVGTVFFAESEKLIMNPDTEVVVKELVVPRTILKQANSTPLVINNINGASDNRTAVSKSTSVVKERGTINTVSQNQISQVSIINQKTESNSITLQNQSSALELLAAVENTTPKEKQLNSKQVVHVDAANLLYQVDGELELSFREKVINKVSKNYQTVKVAFANRNFE